MVLLVCVEIDPRAVYRRRPPQTTGEEVRDWDAYPITTRQAYERAKSSDDYWTAALASSSSSGDRESSGSKPLESFAKIIETGIRYGLRPTAR